MGFTINYTQGNKNALLVKRTKIKWSLDAALLEKRTKRKRSQKLENDL